MCQIHAFIDYLRSRLSKEQFDVLFRSLVILFGVVSLGAAGVATALGMSTGIVTARVRTYDGRLCFHRCVSVQGGEGGYQVSDFRGGVPGLRFSGGGTRSQIFRGGVPGLRFSGGGYQVSDFWGGTRSQIFGGGGTWYQIFGGGVPGLSKGKTF